MANESEGIDINLSEEDSPADILSESEDISLFSVDHSSGEELNAKNSNLEGNLQAAIITLEEGAQFDGMCHMVKEEKQDKKIQSIHEANFSAKNETA